VLIDLELIISLLMTEGINMTGVFHLGAHEAELLALKGAEESIKNVKVIYLEVNERVLYEKMCINWRNR
jgi:hypothetical protein